jgi:thiol-disulfide isomerase/thioredoxin
MIDKKMCKPPSKKSPRSMKERLTLPSPLRRRCPTSLPLGRPHDRRARTVLKLPNLEGKKVNLAAFRGKKTLVLFWNPHCGFCQRMLDDLKAVEADPPKERARYSWSRPAR